MSEGLDRHRLIAARHVAGIRSAKQLAETMRALGYARGFSENTLAKIEAGIDPLAPQKAADIADALGLPRSFFTAPRHRLGDVASREEWANRPTPAEIANQADEWADEIERSTAPAPRQSTHAKQQSARRRGA